ncbi:MAG: RHS repeat protein [Dehalococcoidia bacterium]|nr:RHS repeat protein [Dehalococcoidia bacterium]
MPHRDIGRRTSITYPGGSNQVTYGYDNANRLTSVTDWNSNSTTYSYDDAGRMTTTTLPSGTVAIDTEGGGRGGGGGPPGGLGRGWGGVGGGVGGGARPSGYPTTPIDSICRLGLECHGTRTMMQAG